MIAGGAAIPELLEDIDELAQKIIQLEDRIAELETTNFALSEDSALVANENAELRAVLTELVDRVGYRSVEWAGVTTCSYCGADEPDFAHSEGCAVQKAEAALAASEGSESYG